MDKEDAILLSEFGKTLWAIRQRAIASGELVPKTHDELLRELDPEAYIVKLHEALAASEQRNRELTARLDAAEKLVNRALPYLRGRNGVCPCCGCGNSLHYKPCPLSDAVAEYKAISPTPAQPAAGEAEVEDELDRLGKALTHPALRKVIWP